MIITITREQNTSRSYAYGRQYVWCYLYTFSEDARTALGHVYPAGAPVNYGRGLAACREMLHRNWPEAEVRQAWPAKATTAARTWPTPTTDAAIMDARLRAMMADLDGDRATGDDFTCGCCGAEAEAYGGIVHTHDANTPDCEC